MWPLLWWRSKYIDSSRKDLSPLREGGLCWEWLLRESTVKPWQVSSHVGHHTTVTLKTWRTMAAWACNTTALTIPGPDLDTLKSNIACLKRNPPSVTAYKVYRSLFSTEWFIIAPKFKTMCLSSTTCLTFINQLSVGAPKTFQWLCRSCQRWNHEPICDGRPVQDKG